MLSRVTSLSLVGAWGQWEGMAHITWGPTGCGGSRSRGLGDRSSAPRLCCGALGREIWVPLASPVPMPCWGAMPWERLPSCSWAGHSQKGRQCPQWWCEAGCGLGVKCGEEKAGIGSQADPSLHARVGDSLPKRAQL